MSIQPLPPDAIAQIKSSTTITSLNGVACELMKNSLDAGSTKIDISVDYGRGGCVVEDDGLGILPFEFAEKGGLGKLYHSSKMNSRSPLHGGQGTFLASLSAMALLSITSHHHQHRSHNTIRMHKSKIIARQTPAPAQQYLLSFGYGTRVTVRDLFGNIPVRLKQRAITSEKKRGNVKEWEDLRRNVVTLLLSWIGSVSVTLREASTGQKMTIRAPESSSICFSAMKVGLSFLCSILAQASFITPDEKSSWVSIGAATPKLEINGAISLDPSASKHVQFIAFGIQPLVALDGQSMLQDEINRLFLNSAFGNEEETEELDVSERNRRANDGRYKGDGYTNRELRGGRKGVDRWPMFYINIQQTGSSASSLNLDMDGVLDGKGNGLSGIIELLQAMMVAFLTKHHFRPKAKAHRPKRTHLTRSPIRSPIKSVKSADKISNSLHGILKPTESKLKLDLLGTNVKLPSFRRSSSNLDSPFDAWSRIKSGKAVSPTAGVYREVCSSGPDLVHIKRPSTAPPSMRSISQPFTARSFVRQSAGPLLSKTGEIIRRPFEEAVGDERQPTASCHALHMANALEGGDEFIVWVNPITKMRSLVNKRTGLTVNELQQRSKAATSSAQSVFSFRSALTCSSDLRDTLTSKKSASGPWISSILASWDNPVFQPTEPTIPQVSFEHSNLQTKSILHGRHHHCSQIDIDRAFKESSAGINGRISKDDLRNAEVVRQVDRKFILVKLDCSDSTQLNREETMGNGTMLVIIDQHAADERIRIESLMEELCTPSVTPGSGVLTMLIEKPLTFEVSSQEIQLLYLHRQHFANWGIIYDLPPGTGKADVKTKANEPQRLQVRSLPPGILERCKLDPRLLIELIRTEVWKVHEARPSYPSAPDPNAHWLEQIHTCPQGLLDLLKSRACRSAIMFNDELSVLQCRVLVGRLAECRVPFQCAHGRPCLVPLVELGGMERWGGGVGVGVSGGDGDGGGFGRCFGRWKRGLERGREGGGGEG